MDADRLQQRFIRLNRWNDWKADLSQGLFHAAAAVAFLSLCAWFFEDQWLRVLNALASMRGAFTLVSLAALSAIVLIVGGRIKHAALARAHASDWLAAMPIVTAQRQRFRRHQVRQTQLLQIALCMIAAGGGIWRADASMSPWMWSVLSGIVLGLVITHLISIRAVALASPASKRPLAAAVNIAPGTHGLRLLGAAIEPAIARLPRSARWMAGAMLLLPVGVPATAILIIALLMGSLGLSIDLLKHWRERYRIDRGWLAAQPLPARRLFGAYLPYVLPRAGLLVAVFGLSIATAGAPAWFAVMAAVGLFTALAHAALCTYATRECEHQFPLLMSIHYVAMVAIVQVIPPALPVIVIACCTHAWRRAEQRS